MNCVVCNVESNTLMHNNIDCLTSGFYRSVETSAIVRVQV